MVSSIECVKTILAAAISLGLGHICVLCVPTFALALLLTVDQILVYSLLQGSKILD